MSTMHSPTTERECPQVLSSAEKQSAQDQADQPTSQLMVQRSLAMTTDPFEVATVLLRTPFQRKKGIRSLWLRMVISTVVALTLLVSIMSAAAPRAAASVGPAGWGYAWANQPSSPSYTPSLSYQFNSTGATNTIMRTGIGAYTISFPNLGAAAGTVQVTAYGWGTHTCKVASWGPSGTTQLVNVRCFNTSGTPVDTYYTVTYARPLSTPQPMAYVWADQPSSASYTPSLPYQFNSTGAINTITRLGTGYYSVNFPYQSLGYGDVQVTAYGSGSEFCKVVYWTPNDGVRVSCFDSTGTPKDTNYDVTFLSSYLVG